MRSYHHQVLIYLPLKCLGIPFTLPLLPLPSKSKLWILEWPPFEDRLQNLLPDLPPQRPFFSCRPLPQILCSSLLSTAYCNKVKLLGLTPQNFWNLPVVVPHHSSDCFPKFICYIQSLFLVFNLIMSTCESLSVFPFIYEYPHLQGVIFIDNRQDSRVLRVFGIEFQEIIICLHDTH